MSLLRDRNRQVLPGSWREYCRRQTALRGLIPSLFKDVSDEWHEAATLNDFLKLPEVRALPKILTEHNYTRTMRTLLMMETAHDAICAREFDMVDQHLEIFDEVDSTGNRVTNCRFRVAALPEGQSQLFPGDVVVLHDGLQTFECADVMKFSKDSQLVTVSNGNFHAKKAFLGGSLGIAFVLSNICRDYCIKALARFDNDPTIRARVFGNVGCCEGLHVVGAETQSDALDGQISDSYRALADWRLNQLNEEQRQAATKILEASCFPKPYVLLGPPGTGATHTLAETIAQIYVRKPRDRILYCANSNTCADQMVIKLREINLISGVAIFRLFAGARADSIGASRIIVTTNIKSASLMDEHEFDYVFVDEAAHAHEPESLIPICCLKKTGCLVLAGDSKQLGPIVKTGQAESDGLGRSLLERILLFGTHKREKIEGRYDSRYITKLSISYRCDRRILAISNKLFYDDELKCANETPKSILKMMRIDNPLQFLFVKGRKGHSRWSNSKRNFSEAKQCVNLILRFYKMGITPDQIGVISAYKLQAQLIANQLETVLKSLRANLDERFQGIELVKRATVHDNHSTCDSNPEASGTDIRESELGKAGEFRGKVEKMESDAEEVNPGWVEVVKRRQDRWLCKIGTVDAFQGDEREIIIISTVRTPGTGRADFINDSRRFNVAVSRAKWLVLVVGHRDFLKYQSNWREFLKCASVVPRSLSSVPGQ